MPPPATDTPTVGARFDATVVAGVAAVEGIPAPETPPWVPPPAAAAWRSCFVFFFFFFLLLLSLSGFDDDPSCLP